MTVVRAWSRSIRTAAPANAAATEVTGYLVPSIRTASRFIATPAGSLPIATQDWEHSPRLALVLAAGPRGQTLAPSWLLPPVLLAIQGFPRRRRTTGRGLIPIPECQRPRFQQMRRVLRRSWKIA